MNYKTINDKINKMPGWLKWVYYIVLFETGLLLCFWLEVPVFYNLSKLTQISMFNGLLNMLKESGYFFTWIIVSAAILLIDYSRREKGSIAYIKRSLFLLSSALLSGLTAEILKLIIRRERPEPGFFTGGNFREWVGSWWKSNDLGTPSSHAMVAFGAAWALCVMFPQARIVWIFIAAGCAISRMVHQAHLLGDVYIAAVASYIITAYLAKKILGKNNKAEK